MSDPGPHVSDPTDRIPFPGRLSDLCERACRAYGVGAYRDHDVVETGYEDLNLRLETTAGTVLLKVFSETRDPEMCARYADLLVSAVDAGVTHPRLLTTDRGALHTERTEGIETRMVLMAYVDGHRLDRLDRPLDEAAFRALGREAATIHALDAEPTGVYDSWSVANFAPELDRARDVLDPADRVRIEEIGADLDTVDLADLPRRFVHNDLRETNLILAESGDLIVLDFGVADRYPRIFEFAVLATTTARGSGAAETERNLAAVVEGYDPELPFTEREREAFPTVVEAARAMEVIRSSAIHAGGDDSSQTRRWLDHGREGLRRGRVRLP